MNLLIPIILSDSTFPILNSLTPTTKFYDEDPLEFNNHIPILPPLLILTIHLF